MFGDMSLKEACEGPMVPVAESVEVRLERRLKSAEQNVEDIKAALAVLKEQPKFLEALNLLRRVGI